MSCISNKSRKRERLLSSETVPGGILDETTMGTVRDLREFLQEAELDHYYNAIKNELKIATIPQLKYVEEDDLISIGMTKPEMRRLKKFYKKECPQGKLHKLKQAILTKTHLDGYSRSLSPSPPEHRTRPQSYIRHPGKQIISPNSIHVSKNLGEGEFGVVQQGVWTTEDGEKVQVAIKCLSKEKMHNGTSEFLKEAGLMQSIEHENIARMYGVVLDKDNALMLVTELAPMRSLLECLKEASLRPDFPIPRLCDFAQQICDGMSYLESKRLIHRDLAARNILVFSKTKVKISDFGLSRALGVGKDYYQSNFSINLKLPIAWCAPECINYLKFTSASDVWAYAVTVWEMFTYGFQPWAGMTGQQILDAIDVPKCQRLEQPDLCSREYYRLMMSCWDQEPEKRPTFSEIFIRLPQMRPTQVKAVKDFPEITVPKDYLYYKAYDVIIVLDKTPDKPPRSGLWTGATINGKNGYFDPTNVVPFIEPKSSPVSPPPKPNISRKDSKRISSRKLRADMISRPQNDLRHTGHIGYDGAVFGDVSFIGDNYDKLPLKVMSTGKLNEGSRVSSSIIHAKDSPERDQTGNMFSNSLSDLRMNGAHKTNGFSRSWISQESLDSTSLLHTESDGIGTHYGQYQDIDDDSLLSDFKMPDISSSFDFGPSFMDEVLKALNEKEAALESSQDKASSSSSKDNQSRTSPDKNLSISPPKDMKLLPPPLPVQPPRAAESCCDVKPEARKQAKVKPMSASEEKMIDDAMALANELDRQNSMSQMVNDKHGSPSSPSSDKVSDSESGSESPRLLSKIKMSMKRSPKNERKRTFSEEMATRSELDESVPPEAQEAYNMLVVHGAVKEVSKNRQRPCDIVQNQIGGSQRDSVGSGLGFSFFDRSSNASSSSHTPDRNSQSPDRRTPDRSSPPKTISRSSSERVSVSPPSNIGRFSSEKEVTPDRKVDRPVPRPRLEGKRSEIPVPKPRPEINRVEPTPRQPPPPIPEKAKRAQETTEEKKSFLDTALVINEDDFKISEESVSDKKQIEILRVDLPNSKEDHSNASSSGIEFDWSDTAQEASKDSSQKSGAFDEEFSEPSPREIMSKLARESRLRRSIEHQRGLVGEGDAAPNRNLRAPQGIPGKSYATSSSLGDDDEEIDTNPLRMLRGGAIPIRGGRGGSGTRSSNLQYPKIHLSSTPAFHHSLSVDTGSDHLASIQREADANFPGDNSTSPGPALPPRCFSVYGRIEMDTPNLLPLPPKNPRRPAVENLKSRERKYPLVLNNNNEGHLSVVTCIATTAYLSESCQSSASPAIACSLIADIDSACSPLHDSDKGSYPDLPPAPPPPIEHDSDECTLDDSVFEGSDSPQISKRNLNLSRDGGSSGASTFPRGMKFGLQNVKWNLEQLGFYNNGDPFWVKSVVFDERSYSDRSASTDAEASPLMLANYKTNSEGVSYEDLLDFALDRQKNGEEVETMQKLLSDEVSAQDCVRVLEETKWDLQKAIKYIKLKQLLSIQLGDVNHCKTALLACDWDVQRAADYMLSQCPPSPECIDV